VGVTAVTLLLTATLGAFAALALLETTIRRSVIAAVLIAGLVLVSEAFGAGIDIVVGGLRATLAEFVWPVLLVAAVARLLRAERVTGAQQILLALMLLVLYAVAAGVPEYGLAASMNEARRYLLFVPAALYFSTLEPSRELFDRMGWVWLGLAVGFGVVALIRWGAFLIGLEGGIFGTSTDMRVLPAAIALILLQGGIIAAMAWQGGGSRWLALVAAALLPMVVLLQHRTVWVAAVVAVCLAAVRHPRFAGRLATGLLFALVVSVAVFSLAFEEVAADGVGGGLSVSAADRQTWEWRVDGWQSLLEERGHSSIEEHLFGQPFGSGWDREVEDGRQATVSPHNFYLEVYLRLGLVGVMLLFGLYAWVTVRLWRGSQPAGMLSGEVLLLLVATQLVYYIPYAIAEQAVLFGLAASAAAAPPVAVSREHPERRPDVAGVEADSWNPGAQLVHARPAGADRR
jgi:O-antigen ligase